ncbi:hypothetical protein Tco_0426337 [Tanacetum coccineum]
MMPALIEDCWRYCETHWFALPNAIALLHVGSRENHGGVRSIDVKKVMLRKLLKRDAYHSRGAAVRLAISEYLGLSRGRTLYWALLEGQCVHAQWRARCENNGTSALWEETTLIEEEHGSAIVGHIGERVGKTLTCTPIVVGEGDEIVPEERLARCVISSVGMRLDVTPLKTRKLITNWSGSPVGSSGHKLSLFRGEVADRVASREREMMTCRDAYSTVLSDSELFSRRNCSTSLFLHDWIGYIIFVGGGVSLVVEYKEEDLMQAAILCLVVTRARYFTQPLQAALSSDKRTSLGGQRRQVGGVRESWITVIIGCGGDSSTRRGATAGGDASQTELDIGVGSGMISRRRFGVDFSKEDEARRMGLFAVLLHLAAIEVVRTRGRERAVWTIGSELIFDSCCHRSISGMWNNFIGGAVGGDEGGRGGFDYETSSIVEGVPDGSHRSTTGGGGVVDVIYRPVRGQLAYTCLLAVSVHYRSGDAYRSCGDYRVRSLCGVVRLLALGAWLSVQSEIGRLSISVIGVLTWVLAVVGSARQIAHRCYKMSSKGLGDRATRFIDRRDSVRWVTLDVLGSRTSVASFKLARHAACWELCWPVERYDSVSDAVLGAHMSIDGYDTLGRTFRISTMKDHGDGWHMWAVVNVRCEVTAVRRSVTMNRIEKGDWRSSGIVLLGDEIQRSARGVYSSGSIHDKSRGGWYSSAVDQAIRMTAVMIDSRGPQTESRKGDISRAHLRVRVKDGGAVVWVCVNRRGRDTQLSISENKHTESGHRTLGGVEYTTRCSSHIVIGDKIDESYNAGEDEGRLVCVGRANATPSVKPDEMLVFVASGAISKSRKRGEIASPEDYSLVGMERTFLGDKSKITMGRRQPRDETETDDKVMTGNKASSQGRCPEHMEKREWTSHHRHEDDTQVTSRARRMRESSSTVSERACGAAVARFFRDNISVGSYCSRDFSEYDGMTIVWWVLGNAIAHQDGAGTTGDSHTTEKKGLSGLSVRVGEFGIKRWGNVVGRSGVGGADAIDRIVDEPLAKRQTGGGTCDGDGGGGGVRMGGEVRAGVAYGLSLYVATTTLCSEYLVIEQHRYTDHRHLQGGKRREMRNCVEGACHDYEDKASITSRGYLSSYRLVTRHRLQLGVGQASSSGVTDPGSVVHRRVVARQYTVDGSDGHGLVLRWRSRLVDENRMLGDMKHGLQWCTRVMVQIEHQVTTVRYRKCVVSGSYYGSGLVRECMYSRWRLALGLILGCSLLVARVRGDIGGLDERRHLEEGIYSYKVRAGGWAVVGIVVWG